MRRSVVKNLRILPGIMLNQRYDKGVVTQVKLESMIDIILMKYIVAMFYCEPVSAETYTLIVL
ncbi:MAG: hypothetical protein WC102_11090 [Saccharofermentanales bacterium]